MHIRLPLRMTTAAPRAAIAVVAIALGTVASASAAHAEPTKRPLCVYQATPGASGYISNIKCTNPDGTGSGGSMASATWDGLYLMTPDGTASLGYYTANSGTADYWVFDPTLVSFSDFKKELSRDWGYRNVVLTGDSDPSGDIEVKADHDTPSKKKN